MKLEDLTEEFEGINEAPPGGWLNTKAIAGKADQAVRTGAVGNFLGKLNKAVNKKFSRGSDMNVPDAGIKDKETDDYIQGKQPATAKPNAKASAKASAPKVGTVKPTVAKEPPVNSPDKLKVGSGFNSKGVVYTWTGTDWKSTDGKTTLKPNDGWNKFKNAQSKGQAFLGDSYNPYFDPSIAEAPPAPGMDQAPAKPDPKVTQQVAQKATALKGVMGGKGSGAMVAKGLDKVAAGETLPPNIIKAIAPYAQGIQAILSNPQLMTKFKQLMKQAQSQ